MLSKVVSILSIAILAILVFSVRPVQSPTPTAPGRTSFSGTFTGQGSLPVQDVRQTSRIGGLLQGSINQ